MPAVRKGELVTPQPSRDGDPHPPTADLAVALLPDLARSLSSGESTSADITRALLDRIAAVDAPDSRTSLRSVLAVADDALAEATRSDAARSSGNRPGPLHGIPVLVKDNIEARGLPGTAGSAALVGRPVVHDSPLVTRLRDAGAIVIGSTNLSEWANFRSSRSASGWSAVGGLTGNPWSLDRSAGGSSSGSGAAVAAGLAPLAVGTETNGSITCPASLNGVVGLKPTVGSVPTRGVVPLSASQDSPGPMARSVRDAAALYEVLSATVGSVEACAPGGSRDVVVGIATDWLSGDAATDAAFAAAADALASHVADVRTSSVPATPSQVLADQVSVLVGEFVDDLDAYLVGRAGHGVRSLSDVVAFNRAHADLELAAFGQELLERAASCGGRSSPDYGQARRRNVDWARDECLGPAFDEGADVLISPAYRPAWKSDLVHGDVLAGGGAACTPAAILGWPILTVPIALVDGLPVAMCIIGRPGAEALLLSVGQAVETATGGPFALRHRPTWRQPARG